ncbi:radical SAM protein [Nonomuraea lactucae]|uniref:radical SAM protein n=1 Tax=Nonomuraea lactucae TaxID=2249762 RepID=UPI000DE49969|nr:radical SAM protein [Nonomuraea lactucae]
MLDCVVVGCNQMVFGHHVDRVRAMGELSGAHRDLRLSYYADRGTVMSCRDFLNERHLRGEPDLSYDDMLSATVAYLGSFLHRHGLSFDYVNSFQEGKEKLRALLAGGRVRAVAVTTTYYVAAFPLMEVVEFVRSVNQDVKIIVGGPFIRNQFLLHDRTGFRYLLRQIGADFYIVSEQGEAALVRTLQALNSGTGFDGIGNLVRARGDDHVAGELHAERNDLAGNPVDWRLFFGDSRRERRRMVMVRTARSCPFSCSFCSFPTHAGPYEYIRPDDIWRDLDRIESLGCVNSVTFVDDTFNVPTHRFVTVLRGLAERGYSFRWNCNFRCQYANEETVSLMKEAGCEGVFLGLESGSDAILANMRKQVTADAYRRGLALLKDAGILTYASFIVGFPGETERTVRETTDLIEEGRPDFFRAQLWYYDRTTPIHQEADRYGLANSQFEWSHDSMTAAEAASWVDHLHGTVTGSTWLPQNDFDFPGLFCLTSRGWSTGQIKDALRDFNRRVSAALDAGTAPSVDPALVADAELGF